MPRLPKPSTTLYRGKAQKYVGDSEVFPDRELLRLLVRTIHYDPEDPFMFLMDYGGLWYFYLLRYNKHVKDSVENKLLQSLNEAFLKPNDDIDMVRETRDCLQLFWPFLKADYEAQLENGIEKIRLEGPTKKKLRKLQVLTVDGTVQVREHSEELWLPESEPIENTYSDLKLFSKDEIVVLEEFHRYVFKIRIGDAEYVLKELPIGFLHVLHEQSIKRELEIYLKLPRCPNFAWLVGARDNGEGKIDGLILPYIRGKLLKNIDAPEPLQKEKWKKQISDAVRLLHENGIVWSDAKPGNIIIEANNDNAVLIDFGLGVTRPWVDLELAGTKEGDLQGLGNILEFIENR